jgi:hypothetical protein
MTKEILTKIAQAELKVDYYKKAIYVPSKKLTKNQELTYRELLAKFEGRLEVLKELEELLK